eukprot:2510283-Prymnesium_polylepis.1
MQRLLTARRALRQRGGTAAWRRPRATAYGLHQSGRASAVRPASGAFWQLHFDRRGAAAARGGWPRGRRCGDPRGD